MKYYDKQGREIDMMEWGRLHSAPYKRVAETTLEDGTWISTVWLGIDHRLGGDGPPLIFETMVFASKDDLSEKDMARYSTEAEALAGHAEMVNIWSLDLAAESTDNPELQRHIKQEELARDEEE